MDLADFLGIDRAAVEQGTENNRCELEEFPQGTGTVPAHCSDVVCVFLFVCQL